MNTILKRPGRVKRILARFYTGICKIEIKKSITDSHTHKIRPEVVTLYKDLPCRLSHETKQTSEAYDRNTVNQTIMLFLDNDYEIPAGSKITVTQDNVSNIYGCSSEPNVFETHQEIELKLWEDWSGKTSKRLNQESQDN